MTSSFIQGSDAIVQFYKNDWLPFMCASDVSVQISANKVPTRTKGDGQWKKYSYQDLSWNITLSGTLVFDVNNWTGWDFIDNQINFVHVDSQVTFTDSNGNVKTIRGTVMIETSGLKANPSDVVKADFTLQGSGALMVFDGTDPCPTTIASITVTGQTAADGIAHVTYTYTGDVYQVKYKVDGVGDYIYANVGVTIDIPGLANGSHSIEIVPVCQNGYEGTGLTQSFVITKALTCSLAITSIVASVTGNNCALTVNFNSSPTGASMQYSIDGGTTWVTYFGTLTNPTVVNLTGLAIGTYTFQAKPICANGVDGTSNSVNFTITTNSNQSIVNYNFTAIPGNAGFSIYVDGVLTVSDTATDSGSISVMIGQTVLARISVAATPRDMSLSVHDDSTATMLYNNSIITSNTNPVNLQYSWVANGDTYTVTGIISP